MKFLLPRHSRIRQRLPYGNDRFQCLYPSLVLRPFGFRRTPQAASLFQVALGCLESGMEPLTFAHILLNGHYTFQSDGKIIDLDALVAGLELG